ncbi:unnamed protein product [Trifolium pratense]|uniref:Uncharacterized protein n=1 Tax=Trifolium pratense TaxID=57577 RepID=A0ACB0IRG7_TRIPR|nr:unnamed protein product [Trifolium pratense]
MEKRITLVQTVATAGVFSAISFWYGFMFGRESSRKELSQLIEDLRRGNPTPPPHIYHFRVNRNLEVSVSDHLQTCFLQNPLGAASYHLQTTFYSFSSISQQLVQLRATLICNASGFQRFYQIVSHQMIGIFLWLIQGSSRREISKFHCFLDMMDISVPHMDPFLLRLGSEVDNVGGL